MYLFKHETFPLFASVFVCLSGHDSFQPLVQFGGSCWHPGSRKLGQFPEIPVVELGNLDSDFHYPYHPKYSCYIYIYIHTLLYVAICCYTWRSLCHFFLDLQ